MIRHPQHTVLDSKLVQQKLEEFFKEDNIDFDKHGDVIYSSKKDTLALSKIKTNFRNIANESDRAILRFYGKR